MSAATAIVEHVESPTDAAPSMNETLRQWLDERAVFHVETALKASPAAGSDDSEITALADLYARMQNVGIAADIMQGYVLERARSIGDKTLRGLVARCDISAATAMRKLNVYHLFNKLGDMKLADKAADLGAARIRELMPYFGIDGIRQLIEGKALDGMQYTLAAKLPSREIMLWVRQRKTDKARQNTEEDDANGEGAPAYTPTPDDPHWLRLVRDQSVRLAWRIRAEVAVLSKLCEHLTSLKPQAQQRLQRAETAQLVDRELREIGGDLGSLHDALGIAFGAALDAAHAESRAVVALKASREKLNAAVAAETGRRAGESLRRNGMRGRPPASLEAAIESALKADDKTGDA